MFDKISENTEIVAPDELKDIMKKENKKAYIGFEPSGTAHIGWLVCANKIRQLTEAGFEVIILLADWHAYINDKFNGDMNAIRTCGKYMEDVFTALNVGNVKFVYASDIISDPAYWELVIKTGKHASLSRIRRAMTIMGRKADESESDTSRFVYPLMQVADMFYLGVDVALGGMDQRKAHMLARDIAEKLNYKKPIAIHTPLISSLSAKSGRMDPVEAKMSKSKPDSGIFLHDTSDDIKRKLKKAWCPMQETEGNPVMEIYRYIIFEMFDEVVIERPEKFGGNLTFYSYDEMEEMFMKDGVHPTDLKSGLAVYLDKAIKPVRDYFASNPENYEKVKSFTITR